MFSSLLAMIQAVGSVEDLRKNLKQLFLMFFCKQADGLWLFCISYELETKVSLNEQQWPMKYSSNIKLKTSKLGYQR